MKKLFFLFCLALIGLPSRAATFNTVTMVTSFPVTYVAYDELSVKTLKLGLDRNTVPMLTVKQKLSENATSHKQIPGTLDYAALDQLPGKPPALQASSTTIGGIVTFTNINRLSVGQPNITLGRENPSPDHAFAKFGDVQLTGTNHITLGVGARNVRVDYNSGIPTVPEELQSFFRALFPEDDPCDAGKVPQWIQKNNHYMLGCGPNEDVFDAGEKVESKVYPSQWVRFPGVRQIGVSNKNTIPIDGVWVWPYTTENPPPAETCGGEPESLYGQAMVPQEGASCEYKTYFDEPSKGCYFQRDCTRQDGCVYLNEDGTAVNPNPPKVWEKWRCMIL